MAYAQNIAADTAQTGIAGILADIQARFTKYRTFRQTYDEMAALSDRELADLGLHRSNLRGLAYQAVYGN